MHGRGVWLLCAVAACGGSGSTPAPQTGDTFVDGTRLKAKWVQPTGLPKRFAGWYDTQLGEGCQYSFAYWMSTIERPFDATYTCLPSFTSSDGALFADAACTQPVTDVPCDAVHYVELPPAANRDSCTEPMPLYAIGDPVTSGVLYANSGGSCHLLQPGDPPAPASPHLVGAQVALTSLVTAQVEVGSGPGRIVLLTFKGSDGSSVVDQLRAWDTVRSESVMDPDWPDELRGTPGKWEPSWIAVWDQTTGPPFSDTSCTKPALAFSACGDIAVRTIVYPGAETCSLTDGSIYYDAGAKLDLGTIYTDDGDPTSCRLAQAADIVPDVETVAIGAQVPLSAFADVATFEQGTGQVRYRQAGGDTGPIGSGVFYDTTWQTICEPMMAADGVLRCLRPVIAGNGYADAGCTVPLLLDSDGSTPSCAGAPTPKVVGIEEVISTDSCGTSHAKFHEFPITGPHAGAIYTSAVGSCSLFMIPAGSAIAAYDLGPEIPPEMFVELASSTNPPLMGP